MSVRDLKFCRGCATYASWSSGGLCPQCMTREAIEKSNELARQSMSSSRSNRNSYTASGTNTDWSYVTGEVLGGIIALAGFCYFVYWLFT